MQKLLNTVGRALKRGTAQPQQQFSLASLGKSPQIAELKKRMEQIANLNLPLLLVGEVGCGVELCARFLHLPNTQWITPENYAQLVDAPLDLLQQAHDGLLFLSEIGEFSKQEQKGLLLLVSKLGKYNVRLVCATSKPLPELVGQGLFDASLYQVLSVLTLGVPSLREHREDIPELARLMLSRCVEASEAPLREFSTSAFNALRNYSWPGNLIQLENAVKTLALTSLEE
ncbi:MAG: sigma 54-interacting transcriptional regulator, partial [Burkholderiales bacterium]